MSVFGLKSARRLPAPSVPAAILLGTILLLPGATALTTWNETAADFPSGQNRNTGVENGSLALDLNQSLSGNWTKVGEASSPGQRYQHSMVYDPAGGLHVLFGGRLGDYILDDTWTYNMSRNSWMARSTLSLPGTDVGCSMAFDTANGVAVLFAGSVHTADTYTEAYDPATDAWSNKNPSSSPAARNLHSMAFDPATGRVVLFGGRHFTSPSGTEYAYLGDTWTYESSSNNWTNRTAGSAPSPRCGQSMAYDPASGLVVLFGGMNETTVFRDTWTYNPSTNVWTYCSLPSTPPARHGASMAADAAGAAVILFGGQSQTSLLDDTWSYNVAANAWTSKGAGNQPVARWGMAMSPDAASGKMFYFGGQLGPSQGRDELDDFGSYDPASNNWTKLGELAAPAARNGAAAAFDPARGTGILFGGYDGKFFSDTWTFNASMNRWTRKHPASSPAARSNAEMIYDSHNRLMMLFGGQGSNPSTPAIWLCDTWTYNIQTNTWTNRNTVSHPPGGTSGSFCMAYDPGSGLSVYFGGQGYGVETWTYNATENSWTRRTPSTYPPGRNGSAMVYDGDGRSMVLFGGKQSSGWLNDTWVFNTSEFDWSQRDPDISPEPRWFHGMTYDSAKGASILFGGRQDLTAPHPLFNDTWAYNSTTDSWTDLGPAVSPSAREGVALFHDSNLNAVVLFGGNDLNYRSDTWLLGTSGRYSAGTFTSAPRDSGGKAYFGSLGWQSSTPANTSAKFQFRTGSSPADLEARAFTGPDGSADTFFTSSGQRIPSAHDGSRWMQYKAYLASSELLKTPFVSSVTVDFNLLQTVNIGSPAGGENWTGRRWINWSAADPDGDTLLVDIYLVNETGGREPLAVSIPSGAGSWLWDTYSNANGTYRISVAARDTNPSIPLTAESTSGLFTLYHNATGPPPINHPPVVIMRSPVDGASLVLKAQSPVLLEWNGSDPDADAISYTVYISSIIFNLSGLPPPSTQTAGTYFSTPPLNDNTTYYWTVTASDGQAVSNGSVWKFMVKFGIPNIPPRITSLPPANATVGVEMDYDVTAVDEDGGNITFSLTTNVDGMVIDPATGRLNWIPRPGQGGDVKVTVKASDGQGGYAEQKFMVFVAEPPVIKPVCKILFPGDRSIVRGTFRVNGSAENGTYKIVRLQVRIDQRSWNEAGRAAGNWSVQLDTRHIPNGAHTLEARAFDGRNYSDPELVAINVRNPERNLALGLDPTGPLMLVILLAAALFLGWHLLLRKGGPPAMT